MGNAAQNGRVCRVAAPDTPTAARQQRGGKWLTCSKACCCPASASTPVLSYCG